MNSEKCNRFRVYVERKNLDKVLQMLNTNMTGYTFYEAKGVYNCKHENTIVFECISDLALEVIYEIAEDIKAIAEQESVLLTVEPIQAIYI